MYYDILRQNFDYETDLNVFLVKREPVLNIITCGNFKVTQITEGKSGYKI